MPADRLLIIHSLVLSQKRLVEFQQVWIANRIQRLGFVSLHVTRLQKNNNNNNTTNTPNHEDLSFMFYRTCVNLEMLFSYNFSTRHVCVHQNHIICWQRSLDCHKIARRFAQIEVNLQRGLLNWFTSVPLLKKGTFLCL